MDYNGKTYRGPSATHGHGYQYCDIPTYADRGITEKEELVQSREHDSHGEPLAKDINIAFSIGGAHIPIIQTRRLDTGMLGSSVSATADRTSG